MALWEEGNVKNEKGSEFFSQFLSDSEARMTEFGLELYLPQWKMKDGSEPQLK